jgi:hypothetical protein
LLVACAEKLVDLNVTIVDQKTALENQIFESYEEQDNDVLLLASVRSIDEEVKLKPATKIPKGKLDTMRVMQRQGFNQDNLQDFKNPKVVGEGNDGLLKYLRRSGQKPMPGSKSFPQRSFQKKMKTK